MDSQIGCRKLQLTYIEIFITNYSIFRYILNTQATLAREYAFYNNNNNNNNSGLGVSDRMVGRGVGNVRMLVNKCICTMFVLV